LTSLSSHKKQTFKLEGLSSFKTLINKNDSKKTIMKDNLNSEQDQPINNSNYLENINYRNNKIEFSQHSLIRNKDLFTMKKQNEELKNQINTSL
jgi:hypothetical protein